MHSTTTHGFFQIESGINSTSYFKRNQRQDAGSRWRMMKKNDYTVLFGGINSGMCSLGDTWIHEGKTWRRVRGRCPAPRRYASMTYNPDLQGCLLHGGSDDESGEVGFGDSWLFRDGSWVKLDRHFATQNQDDHSMIYHQEARKMVMFGGVQRPNELLVLNSEGWDTHYIKMRPERQQCTQLVWNSEVNAVLMFGGETHHEAKQSNAIWLLKYE